jgi:hypothetical protein
MLRFAPARALSIVTALGLLGALLFVNVVPASATTRVDCSANPSALQRAIDAASPGTVLNISGTCNGTFTVSKNITLKGTHATLDARGQGTTLAVSAGNVKIVGFTIRGGTGTPTCGGSCPRGGGIWNHGTLTIANSTVSGNSASAGVGGILNWGTLTITNSTVSGNKAPYGGGIYNVNVLRITGSTVSGNEAATVRGGGIYNAGTLRIANSTISGNTAPRGRGGGIFNVGTLMITSSSLSGNAASSGGGIYNAVGGGFATGSATLRASINGVNVGGDCSGGVSESNGYNLTGADCGFAVIGDQTVADTVGAMGLKPLDNYGGRTQTMALIAGSPAVDAIPVGALATDGNTQLCPAAGTTDQRMKPRPAGAGCDVGAYELTESVRTNYVLGSSSALNRRFAIFGLAPSSSCLK